ncbi:MAG: FMN-binding glutamate synthase family protein [Acidimicrobiales bacterium]
MPVDKTEGGKMSGTGNGERRFSAGDGGFSTTPRQAFFGFAVLSPLVVALLGLLLPIMWWALVPLCLAIAVGMHDAFQRSHAILRQYPILGHGRYLAEAIRPEIQQYFVESDTNGAPFSREVREIVYQRAKGQRDKLPFGTQLDVYEPGYEFIGHSMYPKTLVDADSRVTIGGPTCTQPYSASLLNVSAMSFGALSSAAITALSTGARRGGFAHNTGEGGVSRYHLAGGADLIWQIGTGYFGCRNDRGRFDPDMFAEQAEHPSIKAIEIKLSQGAKPGHGGILPGAKVTEEIAKTRRVPVGKDVNSPPAHTAFDSAHGLLEFVDELRTLSEGKPVGFKLCVGQPDEFRAVVDAMVESGIRPDFITVDGAEGGTGAAPPELSDSMGMPLREGLSFVHQTLVSAGERDGIRIIAAGKVATGFDVARCLSLGADLCYSARAMMLALGCIQARKCHTNHCPVGIATQDQGRAQALVVGDKATRVHQFHRETIANFIELLGAAGCSHPSELELAHISRRIDQQTIVSYEEIFGQVEDVPVASPVRLARSA